MKRHIFQVLMALAVCLALAGTAGAVQGKGGGKAKAGAKSSSASVEHSSSAQRTVVTEESGTPKTKKGKAAKSKSSHQTASAGPDDRPPGWDQGGKKGWGDCDVPPGLAKKRGCNSTGYSTRERVELRRQREARAQRTTTTTTARKTTTTTTTTQTQQKDGGVLKTIKDTKEKAATKTKPVQE